MIKRMAIDAERYEVAVRIASEYPVWSSFVYDLLEFFHDDEYRLRLYLDLYSPLGFIPSAEALRQSFAAVKDSSAPKEPTNG
jgi:hypothetical protein